MFSQRDKLSQAKHLAQPCPLSEIPSPEFTQAMAWHLMVPYPAYHLSAPFPNPSLWEAAQQIWRNFNGYLLPFGSLQTIHDTVIMEIQSIGINSGLIGDTEPFGLFSHLILAHSLLRECQPPLTKRMSRATFRLPHDHTH